MGTYRAAKICPNGHVATTAADQNHELREAFCSQSGEATIIQYPKCSASIGGDATLKAFSDLAETTSRPPSATTAAVGSLGLNARLLALLSLLKQALT